MPRKPKTHPYTKRLLEFRLQPVLTVAGTREIFNLAEANARGILFVNFSRFTIYVMEEASSSASKSLYRFRVDPFTVLSSPIDLEYINILVDAAPDGSLAPALPNEFIQVGLFEHKITAVTYNVLSQRVTIANTPIDVNVLLERGAPNFVTGQVSVGAAATLIAAARATRRGIIIVNHGATEVFLGDGTVTVATGLKLEGIDGAAATLDITGAISGIVAAGSQTVSFMEVFD